MNILSTLSGYNLRVFSRHAEIASFFHLIRLSEIGVADFGCKVKDTDCQGLIDVLSSKCVYVLIAGQWERWKRRGGAERSRPQRSLLYPLGDGSL